MNKIFVEEQALILDSFRLGCKVHASGFRPDFIVGIWRGGSAVGIVVQECLQYFHVETDHIAIRTSYRGMQQYSDMVKQSDGIRVHGLEYLQERLRLEHRLLLVDDVFSSGRSIGAVKRRLQQKLRRNMPHDIRTAAVWHRSVEDCPAPDYYVNKTDSWLVLPYELSGLSLEEIRTHKPWAASELETMLQPDGTAGHS